LLIGNRYLYAQDISNTRAGRGSSPEEIVNTIADKANEDQKIQDTKFDTINNRQ